jgi:hypothetical protein
MVRNGYDAAFADRCFRQIEGFGEYGFPESHAASFALLVYASAWLKCHHPAAFAAGLLNSHPMGFYAPAQIVRDATDHEVEARAPLPINLDGGPIHERCVRSAAHIEATAVCGRRPGPGPLWLPKRCGAACAAHEGSMPALPRQAAHRSSAFHSTPGTFLLTSVFTGTFFVRTSAHVGFQTSYDQQPHSSLPHFLPQYSLGPGMQKSSHL